MSELSDEEKKAIEFLKVAKELKIVLSCSFWNNGEFEFNKLQKQQFDIILNLIETQQKEIEKLKEKNMHITKETVEFVNSHYISKDKIKEKIKKYDEWIKEGGDYVESLEAQRYALNELLEE